MTRKRNTIKENNGSLRSILNCMLIAGIAAGKMIEISTCFLNPYRDGVAGSEDSVDHIVLTLCSSSGKVLLYFRYKVVVIYMIRCLLSIGHLEKLYLDRKYSFFEISIACYSFPLLKFLIIHSVHMIRLHKI